MTLGVTIALVTAACAAAHGCTFCTVYDESRFERDCRERGGQVRTTTARQWCVTDGGTGAALERDDDDGGH